MPKQVTFVELDYHKLQSWVRENLKLQQAGRYRRVSDRLEKFLHCLSSQSTTIHTLIDDEIKEAYRS